MKDELTADEYIKTQENNELQTVFFNGKLVKEYSLQDIRDTIGENLTNNKPVLK